MWAHGPPFPALPSVARVATAAVAAARRSPPPRQQLVLSAFPQQLLRLLTGKPRCALRRPSLHSCCPVSTPHHRLPFHRRSSPPWGAVSVMRWLAFARYRHDRNAGGSGFVKLVEHRTLRGWMRCDRHNFCLPTIVCARFHAASVAASDTTAFVVDNIVQKPTMKYRMLGNTGTAAAAGCIHQAVG